MKIAFRMISAMVAGFVVISSAQAADSRPVVSPDQIPGAIKVDAEALLKLVETTPQLKIIDSRLRADRRLGYIENSVNLPDVETDCKALAKIVPATKTPVLFYCNGPKCGRSGKAATKALTCGYRSIYWFRGGFEEWQAKGYPTLKE